MMIRHRLGGNVFENVTLLRPLSFSFAPTGRDGASAIEIPVEMQAVFRLTLLDQQRNPTPGGQIMLFAGSNEATITLSFDSGGQILVAENPTAITMLIAAETAVLMERLSD